MKRCIFLLATLATTAPAQAQSVTALSAQQAQVEKQKAELQAQINKLNTQITRQESYRKDILDDLRQSESAISDMSRKLDRLLDREQEAKEDLFAVREEEKIQQQILNEQIEELSNQLFNLYVSGVSPWSALLSGKDVQKIGRDLSYLAYISKARAKAVTTLKSEIDRLNKVKKKAQDKQRNLAQLSKDARRAKSDLEKEQKNYQTKLKKIEGDIKSRRQQAGQLKADDVRLAKIIAGIENNIRNQREALRQAEIKRQQQAEERRKLVAAERARRAEIAAAEEKVAQVQVARAKALREQARKAQLEAIAKQREALVLAREARGEVQKAQQTFNLGNLSVAEQEQAKTKLQAALTQQKQAEQSLKITEQSLFIARQQTENAEIERAKARIAQEKAREAQRLLSEAKEDERRAKQAADNEDGLGLSRGSPWPLRGALMGRFGQTRPDTGDVWRGILINASEGAPVKAIASGQVVFSNWVRGFGNLIIVDHGNDYLSVYGYNQSVLRSVGDRVKAGQVIARAGSTGGQVEPALYFEIRRGSQAVDPLQWLAR